MNQSQVAHTISSKGFIDKDIVAGEATYNLERGASTLLSFGFEWNLKEEDRFGKVVYNVKMPLNFGTGKIIITELKSQRKWELVFEDAWKSSKRSIIFDGRKYVWKRTSKAVFDTGTEFALTADEDQHLSRDQRTVVAYHKLDKCGCGSKTFIMQAGLHLAPAVVLLSGLAMEQFERNRRSHVTGIRM